MSRRGRASLGYHYDWTERCYREDARSPFPEKLAVVCCDMARRVGCSIKPEAAIVNYYPSGSCMGGHLDDAELTMDEPIVSTALHMNIPTYVPLQISISIGRAAIFLIGGKTKDIIPVPILIRSGDVVVMSGDSRCCYHGVPHVLSSEEESALFPACHLYQEVVTKERSANERRIGATSFEEATVQSVENYLRIARININARQVVRHDAVWVNKCGSGAMK